MISRSKCAGGVIALALSISSWGASAVPKFSDYPATAIYRGSLHLPELDPAEPQDSSKNYAIAAAAHEGPNFAAHYRLVRFSCGTECTGYAITDVITGKRVAEDSVDFPYEVGPYQRTELPHGIEYVVDSRLLVVHGCALNRPCGSYYYVVHGERLELEKLIKFRSQPKRLR